MGKNLRKILNLILWLVTLLAVLGILFSSSVIEKVLFSIGAILICPLINRLIGRKICENHQSVFRGISSFLLTTFIFAIIIIAPKSVNEKLAVKYGINLLTTRYEGYEKLDFLDYQYQVDDESKGIKKITVSYNLVATDNGEEEQKKEFIQFYFIEKTGQYVETKPKE